MNRAFQLAVLAIVLGVHGNTFAGPVEVVVHRGDNESAPENTLAAAKRCVELGLSYVEIDVRQSKDGVHYILHDRTVDRTTDGTGPIGAMTSDEVDRLDAGGWFSEEFEGEAVPRVDEFVAWAKGKIKIYFDVKVADLAYLVELVERHDLQDECFFWFGNRYWAREFHELAPHLDLKINAGTAEAVKRAKSEFGATIIECPVESLDEEFIRTCRDLGIRIMVREGEPDIEAFRKTVEAGADLINLDHPELFLQVQSEVLGQSD